MSEARRGLNVREAIGISIALMAPSMAANINPQATAGSVGRAVPLAAATLGEESRRPRRDIPRAILGTAIFGGIYFIVVTAIEVMGFGPAISAFGCAPAGAVGASRPAFAFGRDGVAPSPWVAFRSAAGRRTSRRLPWWS
jgi:amino acid transporter